MDIFLWFFIGFVAIMWVLFYFESKNPSEDEWK